MLRVRFQGGANAGRVLEFGDDSGDVVIGRDPDRCQVLVPAEHDTVGREHCALRRVLGTWRLVTSGRHPVWVDGAPAHDGQALEALCELQLGREGPILWIESEAHSGERATRGEPLREPGTHTRLQQVAQRERSTRRSLFGGGVALLLVALLGAWGFSHLRATRARDRQEMAQLSTLQHAQLVEALEQHLTDGGSSADFAAVTTLAAPSVLVVVERDGAGLEREVGTAWVAGPGWLATNAHVAEAFDLLEVGDVLLARTPGAAPRDFPIAAARLHPGYRVFAELAARICPIDPLTGGSEMFLGACDVALLQVEAEASGDLPAPLEIAGSADLESLSSGAEVAFVGYPAEGLLGKGLDLSRPQPSTQVGHVTSVTDVFQRSVSGANSEDALAREAHVVRHDLPTIGGASGSPMLSADGRVIAVVNASNFQFFQNQSATGEVQVTRVPIAGFSFAQRADLVRELLEGTADERQAARTELWRAELERRSAQGVESTLVALGNSFLKILEDNGVTPRGVPERVLDATGSLIEGGLAGSRSFALGRLEPDTYLLCALARARVQLKLTVQLGKEFHPSRVVGQSVAVPFTVTREEEPSALLMALADPAGTDPAPVEFTLHLLRVRTR